MSSPVPDPSGTATGAYRLEILRLDELQAASRTPGWEDEFLAEEELETYRAFRFPKRRLEWLGGRLAAKRLVRRVLAEGGVVLRPRDIRVVREDQGPPSARLRDARQTAGAAGRYPISISHSGGLAGCALAAPGSFVGLDIETVTPREPGWSDLAFHPSERFGGLESDPLAATALWTLKESVLKLLGRGLSIGLWDVRFIPDPRGKFHPEAPGDLELHGEALEIWRTLGEGGSIAYETQTLDGSNICLSVAHARTSAPPAGEASPYSGERHGSPEIHRA